MCVCVIYDVIDWFLRPAAPPVASLARWAPLNTLKSCSRCVASVPSGSRGLVARVEPCYVSSATSFLARIRIRDSLPGSEHVSWNFDSSDICHMSILEIAHLPRLSTETHRLRR